MANVLAPLFGINKPFRLTDIGNGDLALGMQSVSVGQPRGANDGAFGLFGNALPIRCPQLSDLSYAVGTAAPATTRSATDASIPLFGLDLPFRLVDLGDKTFALATVDQPTGTARAVGDVTAGLFGQNIPIRVAKLPAGDYALVVSSAANPRPALDRVAGLWGLNNASRLVEMGDKTFALASADYFQKALGIAPSNLIALWPFNESAGPTAYDVSGNARNATYVNSPTFGQTGIGDGNKAVLFAPGSNQCTNIAVIASPFNGPAGTLSIWFQVRNAGVWTDSANRILMVVQVDGSNLVELAKTSTNNTLFWDYAAGGTSNLATSTYSATTWTHIAITWDKAADKVIRYLNGVQQGATLTGLGVWAGTPANTTCAVAAGNSTGTTQPWDGFCAYPGIWNVALTAAQILSLATIP